MLFFHIHNSSSSTVYSTSGLFDQFALLAGTKMPYPICMVQKALFHLHPFLQGGDTSLSKLS